MSSPPISPKACARAWIAFAAGLRFAGTHLVSVTLRARLQAFALRLEQRSSGLGTRIERVLVAKRQRLDRLRLQLEERNPLRVLERGYAVSTTPPAT